MKKVVILGAGTGGTVMANLLHKRLDKKDWSITVIDKDNVDYYQPGFLFIPFGFYTGDQITKQKSKFIPKGVEFIVSEVERVDPWSNLVVLPDGKKITYDFLIMATGAEIAPEKKAPGCVACLCHTSVRGFYQTCGGQQAGGVAGRAGDQDRHAFQRRTHRRSS